MKQRISQPPTHPDACLCAECSETRRITGSLELLGDLLSHHKTIYQRAARRLEIDEFNRMARLHERH